MQMHAALTEGIITRDDLSEMSEQTPANTVHSFTDIGNKPIKVVGVFPRNTESEIDPNAK